MLIVGLTGGIVSGKTTVAEIFRQLGAQVIDADQIAHTIICPGESAWQEIVDYFGEGILESNLHINRKELGKIVFSDREKLAILNKITHPKITAVIKQKIEELKKNYGRDLICIIDAPLLFEAQLEEMMDKIIVVYIGKEEQLKRLLLRDNLSKEDALRRIESQIPMEKKLSLADYVINNSFSREQTGKQVRRIWKELKQYLNRK
ncbi:MAG: dephospho-CoA kinase [Candidatus Atribacteria bacterium]|nr:dephospho-CoA kinase [Candidatus Atribacteria bacterium]